jgi:hypothetical protein
MTAEARSFARTALRMSAGVIVWAVHFAVIYGYTGLACARRFHDTGAIWTGAVPWVIGIATAIAAALMVVLILPALRARESPDFVQWMSAAIAGLGLIGILYEALPVFMLPVCT